MGENEFLNDAGREYLARLAMGDEEAEKLEKIHEMSVEVGRDLLVVAAKHYHSCEVADFWGARDHLRKLLLVAENLERAHTAVVGENQRPPDVIP